MGLVRKGRHMGLVRPGTGESGQGRLTEVSDGGQQQGAKKGQNIWQPGEHTLKNADPDSDFLAN